jgi:ABC-type polysaccharide/polyol phosphate export permease
MLSASEISKFNADLRESLSIRYLWWSLALTDIKVQYQRSVLGPFWITLMTGIFIFVIALLYGGFSSTKFSVFLPHLAAGWIMWRFLSETVNGGSMIFIGDVVAFNQIRLPITYRVFRLMSTSLLILGHNMLIYLVVIVVAGVPVNANTLLVIPAFALWLLSVAAATLMVAIATTRFRDAGPIVTIGMQVSFFVTPIIWSLDAFPKGSPQREFMQFNIFMHYIDLIRDPLMGVAPPAIAWIACLAATAVLLAAAYVLGAKTRRHIPFWL